MEAFPCFQNAEITTVVNGPITYTPGNQLNLTQSSRAISPQANSPRAFAK